MQISYEVREHSGLVESAPEVMNNDWPKYTSDLHLNNLDSLRRDQLLPKKQIICKILVIFSEDGVADSQNAIDISKTVENEVNKLDTCFDIQVILDLVFLVRFQVLYEKEGKATPEFELFFYPLRFDEIFLTAEMRKAREIR